MAQNPQGLQRYLCAGGPLPCCCTNGGRGRTRTCDFQVRNLGLYPTELRIRVHGPSRMGIRPRSGSFRVSKPSGWAAIRLSEAMPGRFLADPEAPVRASSRPCDMQGVSGSPGI